MRGRRYAFGVVIKEVGDEFVIVVIMSDEAARREQYLHNLDINTPFLGHYRQMNE